MFNPLRNSIVFSLPEGYWSCLLDTTSWPDCHPAQFEHCEVQPNSITLWRKRVFYTQSSTKKLPIISSQIK